MDKLISTTDFVIDFLWESKMPLSETYIDSERIEVIENYTNFLKQKLELWMFVPCKLVDGVWVVIPDKENHFIRKELEEYQEAKERCLFQGWDEDDFWNLQEHHSDIESIIYQNITLTATAQNKLKYDKLRN